MTRYNQEIEEKMLLYYRQLSEKNKRHYASLESSKLGRGGKKYISKLLNISPKTIRKGDKELANSDLYAQIPKGKQRRLGGGRKKK